MGERERSMESGPEVEPALDEAEHDRDGAAPDPDGALGAGDLVELVLAAQAEPVGESPPPRLTGIVIGVLAGFGPGGEPLVDFGPNASAEPVPARSAATLDETAVGQEVALMFEGGDPAKPMLMGLVHGPLPGPGPLSGPLSKRAPGPEPAGDPARAVEVEADGEKVVVSAEKELVLRCGKASITLTRAGKILIRGAYVLTRSSGVNRIQGGSVEIN